MSIALARVKQPIRWIGVALSIAAVLFAALSYFGFWSYVRGDDLLNNLADRLDTSYANVVRQVRPGDAEWRPLIRVIMRYTRANLPKDKTPVVFGRSAAVSSIKTDEGEWTAPTTPIVLLYRDIVPGAAPIQKEKDFWMIGTLATSTIG